MGERSNVQSGATVLLLAVTDDAPQGIPLGIVDNFSVSIQDVSEAHIGVGQSSPQAVSYHGRREANVTWGRVSTEPSESMQAGGITPEHRKIDVHEPIKLVVLNRLTGATLYELIDVLPLSFSTQIGELSSVRENVNMMARVAEFGSELA